MFKMLDDSGIESVYDEKNKSCFEKICEKDNVVKDIDDLIFPDDEPYYVSER